MRTIGAGVAAQRAPHRAVGRARHHRVEGRADAHVLGRLVRLAGLGVLVALAVAVGVEHQRGPALRLLDVAGLVEHLGVDPADIAAAAAGAHPQRLVGVVAELQMMRAEAGLVGGVLAGLRIVHRHPAVGAVERELNGRRMASSPSCRSRDCPACGRSPRARRGPSGRSSSCGCWPCCPRCSPRPNRPRASGS